jgi:serine phosphatase RsbU (regulator of sigma subunit)
MNDIIYNLVKIIRPDLKNLTGQQRMAGTADVLTLLYTFPMALIGLLWLFMVSDWASIRQYWQMYLMMAVILYTFNRLRFFFITEIRTGGYANSDGTMDGIAVWASIFILGPTAIWLKVLWNFLAFLSAINKERTTQAYWYRTRMLSADVAADSLATLIALVVYQLAGGVIPIQGYSINSIAPAFLAVFIQYLGTIVIYSGYMGYVIWSLKHVLQTPTRPAISFFFMALALPALANPFGIMAAGIFIAEGLLEFLFIMLGLLLVAILARRLSQAAEYSRQQSSQIEQLEKLGRAILDAPPDGSKLAEVLQKHVLSMFASQVIVIWTEERGVLVQNPETTLFNHDLALKWLREKNEAFYSMPGKRLPWDPAVILAGPIILCPVVDQESNQPIGEVFLELQTMNIPWNNQALRRQLPAVQSLAAQVASAIHQSRVYAASLAMQKTLQELELARSIQASFLPESIPQIPGWQITATLEPARQIAGDFYDFINLPEGKLGFLIADVADKGLGSALYMALSNTLIRTFANHYPQDPAKVMKSANQQILRNARANLFVTVFFGVLDPVTGTLCYANAGHNPPFLLGNAGVRTLGNTGMPLGIDEENEWSQDEINISPGEMILLYTDGITDAQNNAGEFIDKKIILNIAQMHAGKPAIVVHQGILERVHRFVGDAARFDDLTLVILGRENVQKTAR